MKKTIVMSLLAFTTSVNAQIKVFTGGVQSYGSTTSPATGVKHQFTGNMAIGEAGSTTSGCALINANGTTNASSASRPDYSWLGDATTGIFRPGSSLIGFTIGGSEKFRINSSGQLLNNNSTSSASVPDYSWNGDAATGMFHPAANNVAFTTGYFERMRINNNGQLILSTTGISASNPNIGWTGDVSTGIYQPASQNIGFTINSSEAMRITASKNLLIGTTAEINTRLVTSSTNNSALSAVTTHTYDYGYCQANYVNRNNTKAYAVINTVTGSNVETYNVKGSGDVWAKSTTNWSDKNLKENIDSLQNSLEKIKQLKGVKYNFKSSFVGNGPIKTELGLIAQDVEQIIPEVVNTNELGMKGIVYHNLIPVLIEAIKELDAKNNKLESDLNSCCSNSTGNKANRTNNSSFNENPSSEDAQSYMKQNKPNPFNKETVIEYNIVENGNASILVFDMTGKLLKTIPIKIPGKGNVIISANDFNPGMYYYSLIVNDNEVDTKKMILTE